MSGMDRLTDEALEPDYKGFAEAIMEEWAAHCDIDAGDKFDLAVKFNILRPIPGGYDPEKHSSEWCDAERGDPWYEMNRRASQAAPAPQKPVAWAETDHKGKVIGVSMSQYPWHPTPLYAQAAPAPKETCTRCMGNGEIVTDWDAYLHPPKDATEEAVADCPDCDGTGYVVAAPAPSEPVALTYTNWQGKTAQRTITPVRVWFGSTPWHPEPQWLLTAIDAEKALERDFALKDFGAPAPSDGLREALERPDGAIHNGRCFVDRIEADYSFECIAGPISNCTDWHELRRCFEHMASYIAALTPAPAQEAMRPETLSEHIARDMREGRFPKRSEPQMVPSPAQEGGE